MNRKSIKRIVFLTVILSSSAVLVQAQANLVSPTGQVIREQKYTEFEGSPFLMDQWNPGQVMDTNGKRFTNLLLKYDIYDNQIWVHKEGVPIALDPAAYKEFAIDYYGEGEHKTYHFTNGVKAGYLDRLKYYEVLYTDMSKLLKDYTIKFIDETIEDYGSSIKVKKFVRHEKVYIILPETPPFELKGSKNTLYNQFSDPDAIKRHCSKNKLNIKNPEDIPSILKFYDQQILD